MRHLSLLILVSACTAPPPAPTPPCAETCAGCCDTQGRCRAGNEELACGSSGHTCAACTVSQQCSANTCVPLPPPTCAESCPGCCDDSGICRYGRSVSSCGVRGAACAPCAQGQQCSVGVCVTVKQCDVACGAQCCSGASCTGQPCGNDGGACTTCTAGELCANGACGDGAATLWRLRIISGRLAPARPDGEPWDDKNDPDTKVCANVGDAGQVCTLEASETFTPVWSWTFPTPYPLEQLGAVELSVIDSDFPGETVVDELGVQDLRPRWSGATQQWVLDGASVTQLKVELVPVP
ncbi:MAG: hypothetical protein JNK82_07005 [Myxococcaceae bacterium]|nr:hypothetical protein [Myxococcaceae bacterium]